MNNGEKLTARIVSDAQQAAAAKIAAAEQEKQKALAAAQQTAEGAAKQMLEAAGQKAAAILAAAEAAAERTVRSAVLRQRRTELDAVVSRMLRQLKELPATDYFGLLLSLAKGAATGQEGVMLLDRSDLERLPADFGAELAKLHITVDSQGAAIPDGGFVLCYGQIEINSRFGALAAEKKEQLEDFISRQLFESV